MAQNRGCLSVFLAGFAGLAASLYPCILPAHGVYRRGRGRAPLTLKIMLVVVGLLLPVMLVYNGYQHLVFRGKTREGG